MVNSRFDVVSYLTKNTVKYHLGVIGLCSSQKKEKIEEIANSMNFISLVTKIQGESKKNCLEENVRLEKLSVLDSLTGLLNRRGHNNAIDHEIKRGNRAAYDLENGKNGYSFGLIGLDIDNFKDFNDTYGHAAGDEVLKKVADIYMHVANRDMDIITRPGGEEFSVILPKTDYKGTLTVAKTINKKIASTSMIFSDENGKMCEKTINVSAGVAVYRAGDTPESIAKRADDRLYEAKGNGRNCVVGR